MRIDIFSTISAHIVKGLMIHEKMCDYYDFLSLQGYVRCHEYHYLSESIELLKINRFYISKFGEMIPETRVDSNIDIIPSSWYRYKSSDVDSATKKSAVKDGLEKWKRYEEETKELYEDCYRSLINEGDLVCADYVMDLIRDVTEELDEVSKMHLDLKSIDFDMNYIIDKQEELKHKYTEMSF